MPLFSFCSIVIDGLLIAASQGVNLFDTIHATAKKAITKIVNYWQLEFVYHQNLDLDENFQHFFPAFKKYFVDFKNHVASPTQTSIAVQNNDAYGLEANIVNNDVYTQVPSNDDSTALAPVNWAWNHDVYEPNYYATKVHHSTISPLN